MPLTHYISPRHATAYLVAIMFVWVPASAYCDYRLLFGSWTLATLFALASAGGAVAFALFTNTKDRLLALVTGSIAGIGAVSAYIYFLAPWDRCLKSRSSLILLFLGAAPGFLLLWLLKSRRQKQ